MKVTIDYRRYGLRQSTSVFRQMSSRFSQRLVIALVARGIVFVLAIALLPPILLAIEPSVDDLRVMHFPTDRMLGVIYVREHTDHEDAWQDWTRLAPATGVLRVASTLEVRLDVGSDACRDLSPIRNLHPDAIQMIQIRSADLSNDALANIEHLTGLQSLELSSCRFDDSDVQHLSKLKQLKTLSLSSSTIGDVGIANLLPLESLTHLSLSNSRVTDNGMVDIPKFKFLKHLDLTKTDVSDAGLVNLRDLPGLESLNLSAARFVTDAGLQHLTHLTELRTLDLSYSDLGDSPISDVGLVHLERLANLMQLRIQRTKVTDAGLVHIGRLSTLKELDLPRGISDDGLARLSGLSNLSKLTIYPSLATDKGLAHLSQLKDLEYLSLMCLDEADVTDQSMTDLAKLKRLKTLWLQGTNVTDSGLETLAQLESLQFLLLRRNQITFDGLRHLSRFPALTKLSLYELTGCTASLRHLSTLKNLTSLSVGGHDQLGMDGVGTGSLDEGVGYLSGLTRLQRLELNNVALSDEGMKQLAPLTSLRILFLRDAKNEITNDGLTNLSTMKQLESLAIAGAITDRGFEHLAGLTSLRIARFHSRTISEAAINSLKKQLPSLQDVTKLTRPIPKQPPLPGEIAPDFEITDFEGNKIRLSELQGKAVLLYFWATWCSPCVKQTPELKELHEALASGTDPVEMVGLCMDDDESSGRRHAQRHNIPWPQAWIGLDSPICAEYAVEGAPHYVLVGKDGKVRFTSNGQRTAKITAQLIEQSLLDHQKPQ